MDGKKKLDELVALAEADVLRTGWDRVSHDTIRSISDAYKAMEAENERLRKIISECATALGNGAHIDPGCTVEFMGELPREIELRIAALCPAILEEAAKVADKYPERDPAEDGNGYWAAGEIAAAIRALAHTTGQAASSTDATAPAQAAGQLELTPLHLELLRRGSVGRYISLTGDMTFRHAEMDALSELRAAGYAEHSKDPLPPGPPRPTASVITDAGRSALSEAEEGR